MYERRLDAVSKLSLDDDSPVLSTLFNMCGYNSNTVKKYQKKDIHPQDKTHINKNKSILSDPSRVTLQSLPPIITWGTPPYSIRLQEAMHSWHQLKCCSEKKKKFPNYVRPRMGQNSPVTKSIGKFTGQLINNQINIRTLGKQYNTPTVPFKY
eukprot:GHVR01147118.1.p1 GENE.GHVR01147118.1~~GHVR01147118.1.p1  ORF type:complete len:153 (+),score=30.11 GHVR01147118.1:1070-1528(+)